MTCAPRSKISSASEGVMPKPPAAFFPVEGRAGRPSAFPSGAAGELGRCGGRQSRKYRRRRGCSLREVSRFADEGRKRHGHLRRRSASGKMSPLSEGVNDAICLSAACSSCRCAGFGADEKDARAALWPGDDLPGGQGLRTADGERSTSDRYGGGRPGGACPRWGRSRRSALPI